VSRGEVKLAVTDEWVKLARRREMAVVEPPPRHASRVLPRAPTSV